MSDHSSNPGFDTDIAIVGMAGRFAGARDLAEYWRNLRDGVESLTRFSDEELVAAGVDPSLLRDPSYVKVGGVLPDMEMFDARFFGFSPREAAILDPQHRHFLECAWEALENAGHVPGRFEGSIGVFGGSGHNAYLPYNLLSNPKLVQQVGFFLLRHTGNDKDFLTTRVSYLLNLKGPSVNVQTACSTSLVAIHMACQSLLNGETDMALAGGVTIELPHRQGYLYQEGEILSPDGHCRPFDANSQGTVFGSGVGVVVLRRLADAIADGDHIHAVVKGSAINNDGSGKVGYLAPSVDGQARAIAEALAIANVPTDSVTYVEAHGTGTPVGDPIEVAALTQAFRQGTDKVGYCGIGSVKSNIGHTDTAAGVASLMKVALAMQHGQIPPTLHFGAPNPACDFDGSPFKVTSALTPWTPPAGVPRRAGISSLGVGGTNAHVVLEQAPARKSAPASRPWQVLVVSGKTAGALERNTEALAAHFEAAESGAAFADAAYTLQVGRSAMSHRRVAVARNPAEAAAALRDPKARFDHADPQEGRSIAFMFAGGGAQYPNMGLDLYRSEPVFRAAIDECLAILAQRLPGTDFKSVLFPAVGQEQDAARQLERPTLALPMLLAVQYAQAKLWMSWGIQPSAMIGHSMGEYTAAHLAGVFTLADALTLVHLRGRLFETLPEGGMLSVPLSEVEVLSLMGAELSVAAVNGPKLTVASGPVQAIEALQNLLAEREIEASRVRISVAAHSSMLEPILGEFGAFVRGIAMRAPTLPFVSNLSGTWITPAEATDPAYWVRHLRSTVRFADGLRELLKDDKRVLLEVGPGRTLSSLARQHSDRAAHQPVLNSLRHPDEQVSDQAFMLGMLGRLWAHGVEVDWPVLHGNDKRLRVPLPTYRFEAQRHWVDPGTSAPVHNAVPADRPLFKRPDLAQWFYEPVWKRSARLAAGTAPERALVFLDEPSFGEALVRRLRERGTDVVVVRRGPRFQRKEGAFRVNPAAPADFDALVATLAREGRLPQQVFHLWTLSGPGREAAEQPGPVLDAGFYCLLHIAQAIGREDIGDPIGIVVVSDRLQRVAGETDVVPAKATVLGPCKVIPREFPNLRCSSVDLRLPPAGTRQESLLCDDVIAEAGASDDVVALRAGERWVQSFEAVPLPEAPAGAPALRQRGVYVVTGGLGGVGLALAAHLARTVQARLVLLGRNGLPPRADWDAWVARHEPAHPVSRRIAQVREMEAAGAEVLVIAADVTQRAQLQSALKEARARFGAVHGVLHTAGVLDDGVIQLKDAASSAAVLAPKVQGTLALDAALGDEPLDFLVLFSSISSFSGLAGQVDYAAANAFLDAFAQQRVQSERGYTVAVNWSQWAEVGMAAALAQQLGLVPAVAAGGGTPVGHPLVERCLRDTHDDRLYETRFSVQSQWLLAEHRIKGGEALIPGTGYLEIVRAAFAHHPQPRPIELSQVSFLVPFSVADGEARDLRVQLRRQDAGGAFGFVVLGRPAQGEADAPWLEHVKGSVRYVDEPVPAAEPTAQVIARCRERTRLFGANEPHPHLDFGPRWQNIRRIDFGQGEALVTLELPAEYAADLAEFPLHPALLDMATAGAQEVVPGFDQQRDFFVPASYGRIVVHGPLTRLMTSHVRMRADSSGESDLVAFDVTLTDAEGRAVVDIAEFTMLRVRDKAAMSSVERGTARALPEATQPRATANKVLALGQQEGILCAEGAAALERILHARRGPQIVVSPQDLHRLMEQLRIASAAPAPAESAGAADAGSAEGWVAPRTETEKLIAQMWGEMLGVQRVGATANFFELGGHSLLAVQVVNKLKKRTGKTLSLTSLLEAPTVETLAALIEPPAAAGAPASGEAAGAAPAPTRTHAPVRIREGQGRLPVFFVHDGNGETLLYRTLALQLEPGHAVYGLQPERRADGSVVHTRITEMAAAHVRAMRSVQPHGPYLLAGLCAGGVIAFEMARQLQDAGERTLYVGIIDAADVHAEERRFHTAQARLSRFLGTLSDPSQGSALRRIGLAVPRMVRKASNMARYELATRLANMQNARKLRKLREAGELGVDADAVDTLPAEELPFIRLYEIAHREHRPVGVFSGGDVVLFRATQGDGTSGDIPFSELYTDPALGWRPRVQGELQVLDIPGGHSSALQEPHVTVLAQRMRETLRAALARHGDGGDSTALPAHEGRPASKDRALQHDELPFAARVIST